jgi:hypothetical protein
MRVRAASVTRPKFLSRKALDFVQVRRQATISRGNYRYEDDTTTPYRQFAP